MATSDEHRILAWFGAVLIVISAITFGTYLVHPGKKKAPSAMVAMMTPKIAAAPPRSILLFGGDRKGTWSLVCSNDHGKIAHASVSYDGVQGCGSSTRGETYETPREVAEEGVVQVITPADPAYQGKIEKLMLDMML